MAFKAKRQYPRYVLREGVKLETGIGIEFSTFDDVSCGGIKLYLDHEVKIGALIEANFTIPRGPNNIRSEIKSLSRVVRCIKQNKGYTVGLQFLNMSKDMKSNLSTLVDITDGPF